MLLDPECVGRPRNVGEQLRRFHRIYVNALFVRCGGKSQQRMLVEKLRPACGSETHHGQAFVQDASVLGVADVNERAAGFGGERRSTAGMLRTHPCFQSSEAICRAVRLARRAARSLLSLAGTTAMLVAIALFASTSAAVAQTVTPLQVFVDATQSPQKYYHVHETLPVTAGDFTFVYPKWIPGYHGPVGPIEAVVNLHVSAAGAPLPWRRDLADMYAVHTRVPAGVSSLTIDFDVAGAPSHNGQTEPVSSAQIALLEFSNLVVYPQGATAEGTQVDAGIKLPAGWTFGTALPVASKSGDTITFAPASLYTLIDSPVIAGAHERAFPLGGEQELDVAADSAGALDLTPKFLAAMRHLVNEAPALYGGKHYRDYHFLLTLSDTIGFEGIEHHESSDNRAPEMYGADDSQYRLAADLLPHEYSHSWNGKYRRPADLAVPDYQQTEQTDLLWVYEGLNQYNGEKLATRSRFIGVADELDNLALTAAHMDLEAGRAWRPVRDTADGAPFLYQAPRQYYSERRSAGDFYAEGDLIWLDADVTIRHLTHGSKSLDDFCKLWGNGTERGVPHVNPYQEADVYALLNRVAPYDWAGFFHTRIAEIQRRAPLGGITGGGYSLTYTDKPSDLLTGREKQNKEVDAAFSLGMTISTDGDSDGTIRDVSTDSAAFHGGVAPGMRIIAIDGRKWSPDTLHAALKAHKGGSTPLQFIIANGDFVRVIAIDAHGGERFPHLVRVPGTSDVLSTIYAPKTFVPSPKDSAPEHR